MSKSKKPIEWVSGETYTGKAKLLSRKAVAQRLGRTPPHVSNKVRAGELTPFATTPSGAWLFRVSDVNAYVRAGGK